MASSEEILEKLVGFPSVVGTSNEAIVGWIRDYLAGHGLDVHVLPGPEGNRSSLFATIGPRDRPGYLLSGHMDVVPANEKEWTGDPFRLRRDGERLYGRGTTDMKSFLAASLAAVPALAAIGLRRPVHLALSYDEEAGCRGVPHLLARLPDLCVRPLGAIIGEPSRMRPTLAHKGKTAARITVKGRSGHSSRPDLGLNAIHAMGGILSKAVSVARDLEQGPFDARFEPAYSSVSVGMICGGEAVNITPDRCTAELEARAIPAADAAALLQPVREAAIALERDGFGIEWEDLCAYPGLSLARDSALAAFCRDIAGNEPVSAVSYGTEAGLYQQAGIDAIICGPGDMARAHKPNEFILRGELEACQAMIEKLGRRSLG